MASEEEEGPYYIDGARLRRDITDEKTWSATHVAYWPHRRKALHPRFRMGLSIYGTAMLAVFLAEEITEQIANLQPYAKRLDVHRTMQEQDGIFSSQHGSSSIAHLEKASSADGFGRP